MSLMIALGCAVALLAAFVSGFLACVFLHTQVIEDLETKLDQARGSGYGQGYAQALKDHGIGRAEP